MFHEESFHVIQVTHVVFWVGTEDKQIVDKHPDKLCQGAEQVSHPTMKDGGSVLETKRHSAIPVKLPIGPPKSGVLPMIGVYGDQIERPTHINHGKYAHILRLDLIQRPAGRIPEHWV
jgi:hypothetical protein